MKELSAIQSRLKAPKGQYNRFGGYRYRSCEDILEAVKPLLAENACTLVVTDDIELVGSRFYVKATATIRNGAGESETAVAFAREEEVKKGMDAAQVTGSASSYARKYALNGLFCIDDTKDPDLQDGQASAPPQPANPRQQPPDAARAIAQVGAARDEAVLNSIVRASTALYGNTDFQNAVKARRTALRAAAEKQDDNGAAQG